MGIWRYEGLNKKGIRESGSVHAKNEKEARRILRKKGIRAKKIIAPTWLEFDFGEYLVSHGFISPFGNKELVLFTKQLSIMVGAGVPIVQTLEILYKQEQHPILKKSIKKVATDVEEGKTMSESMVNQKGFSKLYVNLIKAGESGGVLDDILIKLTEHLEKQEKIKTQVKSAMMYPAVVSVIGAVIIWGLMVFIVPQFTGLLKETGQEVPGITQFVISVSDYFREKSHVMLAGVIFFVFIFISWKRQPSGKKSIDKISMKIPLFGGIIIKSSLASFSRTLGTMLSSGVSLIDSLDICIDIIDNDIITRDLTTVKQKVIEGKNLGDPLKKIDYFPDMLTQMIQVGEQTGDVDSMLVKCSEVFEEEISILVDSMIKLLEPMVIVVLGGIVATILVAMYLPIFLAAG